METQKLVKCYHASHIVNRKSILEKGLLTSDCEYLKYKNRLCFSINENVIGLDYVGYQFIDVWTFYVPEDKMIFDTNADADCYMYIEECIRPEDIKLEYTID
jgi:hypothetical protein